MKGPLRKLADPFAIDNSRINSGSQDDLLKCAAQPVPAAAHSFSESRAEEAVSVELREVVQVLDNMKMHRHDHILFSFGLGISDDAKFGAHVFPFHLNTIEKPGSDKESENNRGLPLETWGGVQKPLHFFLGENVTLRSFFLKMGC